MSLYCCTCCKYNPLTQSRAHTHTHTCGSHLCWGKTRHAWLNCSVFACFCLTAPVACWLTSPSCAGLLYVSFFFSCLVTFYCVQSVNSVCCVHSAAWSSSLIFWELCSQELQLCFKINSTSRLLHWVKNLKAIFSLELLGMNVGETLCNLIGCYYIYQLYTHENVVKLRKHIFLLLILMNCAHLCKDINYKIYRAIIVSSLSLTQLWTVVQVCQMSCTLAT